MAGDHGGGTAFSPAGLRGRRAAAALIVGFLAVVLAVVVHAAGEPSASPVTWEIRNGGLWRNGKPYYLIGVITELYASGDARQYKPDVDGEVLAYRRPIDAALAERFGINAVELACAPQRAMWQSGWFQRDDRGEAEWDTHIAHLRKFRGLAFVLDHGTMGVYADAAVPRELQQVNGYWHLYCPLCAEAPEGFATYERCWRDAVQQADECGLDMVAYELFNEPVYQCRCARNKRAFADRMKERYGTIEKANGRWKTGFADFEAVAELEQPEETPGLWCDWIKFMGDRYADILARGREAVRDEVREGSSFCMDQCHVQSAYLHALGIDPWKVGKVMDVIGMEGAISFGELRSAEETDPMAMVQGFKGRFGHQFYMDAARAFGKPVLDNEHYCARYYDDLRFPSKRSDLLTALWEEMIHGACGTFFFNWGRRWWEWQDMEGAKRTSRDEAYKAYSLLNPYSYPPDCLNAFNDFARDLKKVGADLMSGLRIRGEVALLVSLPTIRQAVLRGDNIHYTKLVTRWYEALTLDLIPLDVVWEEQLPETDLSRYRAVCAPGATHLYAATRAWLAPYVQRGGRLLTTKGGLDLDEYDAPWPASAPEVRALVTEADLETRRLRPALRKAILGEKDFRPFALAPADGRGPLVCKGYRIRRPSGDYLYVVNWQPAARLARLRLPHPPGLTVAAPLEEAVFDEGDIDKDGVLVCLPSQTRVLLFVPRGTSSLPYRVRARWTEDDVRKQQRAALQVDRAEVARASAERMAARQASERRRVLFDGPTGKSGEYKPDDKTVFLFHFNGALDREPSGCAKENLSFVEGKLGGALHVGDGPGVVYPVPENMNKDLGTVELWVRPDWPTSDGKRHTMVQFKGPGGWDQNWIVLYKNLDYNVQLSVYDRNRKCLTAYLPTAVLQRRCWTHLCGVWDAARGVKLYVNGELLAQADGTLEMEGPFNMTVGESWGSPLEGALDELRVSSRERTPAGESP